MCMGSSARNAELCTMQAEIKDKAWMEHQFTLHQMLKPKAKESKGSEFTHFNSRFTEHGFMQAFKRTHQASMESSMRLLLKTPGYLVQNLPGL